ncbi:porin family protein [Bacteroides ihuae]|uniref:outer membrane beta-barrel protein n=1 Tax=Bacteroides ihuae TaxID=1852362 RepID=UPI0008D954B8|nr:outer membrane beta-barrel protein [Bacteroides ihuae]
MVKQDNELWTKKLRESLKDYSEPYPPDGWQRLEKELLQTVSERRISSYNWWIAAAVTLFIATSVSIYFLNAPIAEEMQQRSLTLAESPDVLPLVSEPSIPVTKMTPMHNIAQLIKAQPKKAPTRGYEEHEEQILSIEKGLKQNAMADDQSAQQETKKLTQKDGNITSTKKPDKNIRKPSGRDKFQIPVNTSSVKNRKWTIGVSVTNISGISNTNDDVSAGDRLNLSMMNDGMMEVPNNQTIVFKEGVPYLEYDIANIEHHQPITFGLSIRKQLLSHFSVETGITYTLLSSDVRLAEHTRRTEQKLHYIGIPLRANWDFMSKDKFTLYLTGGGLVEKSVYGKIGSQKLTVKSLQWSLSGGIGAQLNVSKHIGIYAEPGIAYFFNDGSDVETIRKETPCNLNIQAGVRFTY